MRPFEFGTENQARPISHDHVFCALQREWRAPPPWNDDANIAITAMDVANPQRTASLAAAIRRGCRTGLFRRGPE